MEEKEFEVKNVFGKGMQNDAFAKYFVGNSYLNPLVDNTSPIFLANVTFEPGCRNNWHIHHASKNGGQILICTAGYGWYQEEGKFIYGGLDGERTLSNGEINENRFKYVVGDSSDYEYVIASRSVDVYSGWASFRISSVGQGYVDSSVASLCYSDADNRL